MAEPTDEELETWYQQWLSGRSKNSIERDELNDPRSHGKYITRMWRDRLHYETEEEHHLVEEVRRLRSLLEQHGIPY